MENRAKVVGIRVFGHIESELAEKIVGFLGENCDLKTNVLIIGPTFAEH